MPKQSYRNCGGCGPISSGRSTTGSERRQAHLDCFQTRRRASPECVRLRPGHRCVDPDTIWCGQEVESGARRTYLAARGSLPCSCRVQSGRRCGRGESIPRSGTRRHTEGRGSAPLVCQLGPRCRARGSICRCVLVERRDRCAWRCGEETAAPTPPE